MFRRLSSSLGLVLLTGLLPGCLSQSVETPTVPVVNSVASAAPPIAQISEIQRPPVFVRSSESAQTPAQEVPAQEGRELHVGDTIRTQGQALAQIDLKNGSAFRIGGDAVLTLQPDNRLNLTSGDMITWVEPGRKVPTEIVTPAGVAGIRGTTVYVEISKDASKGIRFFAWEGSVAVRLPGQTEEVMLRTAEEVWVKPGDREMKTVRQRLRQMPRAEWRQKRQQDRLLHGFRQPMPTLPIINRAKPGEADPN
jgi:hypothetical protein